MSTWSPEVVKILEPSVVVPISLPPSVGTVTVVRAAIRLIEHHMLVLVKYERVKLMYTHPHVITSHKLGRSVFQTAIAFFEQRLRCCI